MTINKIKNWHSAIFSSAYYLNIRSQMEYMNSLVGIHSHTVPIPGSYTKLVYYISNCLVV